jgi:chromosome segregation ATPase
MSRNDPARLEAEAKELLEQYQNAAKPTPVEEQPEVVEEEETLQTAPEPQDTAEEHFADEAPEQPSESGEVETLRSALEKAEKAMKGAQSRMTKATQEAAELRKANEQMMHNLAELKGQLAEKERDTQKLSQIREEYPDIAGPLLDELSRTQAEVQSAKEALSAQERYRDEERQARAAEEHFGRIRSVHPDVDELIQSADWMNWLEAQDASTHQWVEQGSSNDVNAVLSRFKEDLGMRPPTPQERSLEKARAVAEPKLPKARSQNVTGEKRTWSVEEIMRMPNKDFQKHQRDILKAMEQGAIRR